MTFVTVFRRVPKPLTGMIGIVQDPDFERFEANLDWLETTGVLVDQFDPSTAHAEVAKRPTVQQILSAEGDRCLPLILVNSAVVSRGTYLSRAQLARAVGQGQGWERSVA
ncbi:MAG TPA: arsenic metallochaperone ArsD family protein [Vicinamibacterales bacterium]|nr:arsenic metallochaperone ArsD family protein [Vicinamibacterales bacterium]